MMPERFELTYTGADNAEHRPVMIHRALLGSFERFIGILVEHYAGEFPLWLSPTQAVLLTIADRHADAAHDFATTLRDAGVRVKVDDRAESVGRKIREAELSKVPYMLVVGDSEVDSGSVSIRRHKQGDIGTLTVADFAQKIQDEVTAERSLEAPVAAATE
jgi:threonyl-tRNA synthetase